MSTSFTGFPDRAAVVQADLDDALAQFRPEKARTLSTFGKGTRKKTAGLAGIRIGYWTDHAHGQTWNSPVAGDTSFKRSLPQKTRAMYAGVVFRNMNFHMEATVLRDMERGKIPDSYINERRRRVATHMRKKNWAAIGDGTGAVASVSGASGSTITCLADNSARGTSKGVYQLDTSTAANPLLYDAVDPATDTVLATFYITDKPSITTATAVFTFGNAAAMNAATYKICESGSWKKELTGIAGHISDSTSRIYQGADVAVDSFLRNVAVDAGNAVVTPSAVHSAKELMMTRANSSEDEFPYIAHCTWINYRNLAKFGYTSRQYNISDNQKSTKTFGLPTVFEDGDTVWVCDSDYEECYIDFREKKPYFEYVHKDFGLDTTGGVSRFQWSGIYGAGSSEADENYTEGVNIVWDGRGADGNGSEGGSPNTAVFIKNISMPTTNSQHAVGV